MKWILKNTSSKAVIRKMFGTHHPPTPKILFKFSKIFGVEELAFLKFQSQIYTKKVLKNALVTYVFGRV